ncbi:recombinase family protein [Mesorhizobium sp. Cs1299R1N1]
MRFSAEEKIDTSSAAGELVFHVFGAIAHFEPRLTSQRTKGAPQRLGPGQAAWATTGRPQKG